MLFNNYKHVTWHCKRFNLQSFGININGNFSGEGWVGTEEPTKFQFNSLKLYLDYLYTNTFKNLNVKNSLRGHSEFDPINKPACPGWELMKFINEYRIFYKRVSPAGAVV